MKKKNLVTGALALTLLFNASGCITIKKEDTINKTSIEEILNQTYKTKDIFVITITLITGEEELIFIDSNNYDIFSNNYYSTEDIVRISLLEYLSVDELKETYTYKELLDLLQKKVEEFHVSSYNESNHFPYEVFNIDHSGEEQYDAKYLKFILTKSKKDNKNEIYLGYYNQKLGDNFIVDFNEFFTDIATAHEDYYPITEFIPTEYLKLTYSESELRALLSFARDIYHNGNKFYSESPKLELTNKD